MSPGSLGKKMELTSPHPSLGQHACPHPHGAQWTAGNMLI